MMRQLLRGAAVLALFACVAVGTAKADSSQELSYSLTGPDGLTATFILPVNPVVATGNYTLGADFQVTPIDLIVNNVADPDGVITFYSYDPMLGGGGFTVDEGDLIDLMNTPDFTEALYTGSEDAPTMSYIGGSIPLEDFMTNTTGYTLTITPVAAPEPAAVLMLGIGLVALFVKRRFSVPA
ncbi:MAG: PEP-CTERM sorting domain-containing protein [Candidatus Acidiferrales bacterium]